jgi:hypothetical protein
LPKSNTIPVIGLRPSEIEWVRLLVSLLRHPDPGIPEWTRQALIYVSQNCSCESAPKPLKQELS